MKTITKPDIENWPNEIKLKISGVPVLIDYEKDRVMLPKTPIAEKKQECIAEYLLEEGFIEIKGE